LFGVGSCVRGGIRAARRKAAHSSTGTLPSRHIGCIPRFEIRFEAAQANAFRSPLHITLSHHSRIKY
jgi:hypothetical protein